MSQIIVKEDYKVAAGFVALGLVFISEDLRDTFGVIGVLSTLFGAFLTYQTANIRFVLDDKAMELRRKAGAADLRGKVDKEDTLGADGLKSSGENWLVGGANRWAYSSWVNYDFFPSIDFPILVYFKENQTPKEDWGKGPGQLDPRKDGQLHFFPAVVDVQQLNSLFVSKGLPSQRYNPKN